MIGATHEKIANRLYDLLGKKFQFHVSRHAFIEGNNKPSFDIKYSLTPHKLETSYQFIDEILKSIKNKKFSRKKLGIRLGIVSHFICDYCTAFHSNEEYNKINLFGHYLYEKKIDDILANTYITISDLDSELYDDETDLKANLESYIAKRHIGEAIPRRDVLDSISICYYLLKTVIEEYDKRSDKELNGSKRIAILTDTYFPHVNGVSNTIYNMIQFFEKENTPYLLISPKYKEHDDRTEEINLDVVTSVKFFLSPETRLAFPNGKKLTQDLDEFKPTVILAMTEFNMGLFGINYAKKNDIPIFTNFSTDFPKYLPYYKLNFLLDGVWKYMKWYHAHGIKTFTPSYDSKNYLESNGIKNVRVLSRGIDSKDYSPNKRDENLRKSWGVKDELVYLYVGRVATEKDIDILIESYNKLYAKYTDKVKLVIVGDGPEKEKCINKLPANTVFTGYLKGEKLRTAYASCDVFSFPSSSETFGNVVLEAMASGLPVIGVNSGGVVDSIQDNYNGLLVAPKNTSEFFEAMEKMLVNKEKRKVYSENAIDFAKTRTWEFIFDTLNGYFSKVGKAKSK